jgi:hypothetical protein
MPKAATVINPFNEEVLTDDAAEQAELNPPVEQQQAAPEPVAKPETQAPAQDQGQQQPPKQENYIPLARFNEVNERMKAAERERNELADKWARMDERSKQVREAQQAAQAAARAAERPDPAVDPVGAQLWDVTETLKQERAAREQLATQFQQTIQGIQGNQQTSDLTNYVLQDVQRFSTQKPDYINAVNYLAAKRTEFWQTVGYDPEHAKGIVQMEAMAVAQKARETGQSPAQIYYNLAGQFGYSNGVAQAPNGQGGGVPNQQPNARIQQLQRGQQAQGIGHLGGAGGEAQTSYRNYTPAQIAALSEREWSRLMADPVAARELKYALAMAEGIDPTEMGRI